MTQFPPRRAAALALGCLAALGLGACSRGALEESVTRPADAALHAGGVFGRPWGGERPEMLASSETVARVMRGAQAEGGLRPEGGDVWPGPLPPRTTLANPDAALSGIPNYDPAGTRRDPSAEAPSSRSGPPRGLPSAGTLPPSTLDPLPSRPSASPAAGSVAPRLPPIPPRADGQVIQTPGGPVVTSGGTDRVQNFNIPGQGTGTAIRDGNTTTLIGPDGRVQVVPSPAR